MVTFSVSCEMALAPGQILDKIFDAHSWSDFDGWGPIPGIKDVSVVAGGDDRIGTCFLVTNLDGSSHRETVVEHIPNEKLVMRMDNFSAPLNRLVSHFTEIWDLNRRRELTYVTRTFELHAKNTIGAVALRPIGYFLRKAVRDHLDKISVAT